MTEPREFGLPATALQKIASVLEKHTEVETALIYGSRAKGTEKPSSDIDLTLTGPGLTFTDLLRIEVEIDDLLLPYKFDLSILSQIESVGLREHIARVGRVLYARRP